MNTDEKRSKSNSDRPKKRLCVFRDEWMKEEDWLRPSPNNANKARCSYCNKDFSIAHGGRSDVTQHSQGAEHKKNKQTVSSSSNLSKFFAPQASTEIDKIATIELASVFHTVKHNLSYNSMDCGNKLLHKFFDDSKVAPKVSCGRTKAEAITTNVLCPMIQETIVNNLKENTDYFSVSTDSSNKGNRKFYPICVQYFTKEDGICSKLLNFVEEDSETSDAIVNCISNTLNECGLNMESVSAFSADNTNANVGKNRSAYTLLQEQNKNLLKSGCLAHVVNNAFRKALDTLELDVESIVLKIYSHFSRSSVRRHELKDFFDFVDLEFKELLKHIPTRWLSLVPAIDRLIKSWPALMSYFISQGEDIPKCLRKLLMLTEESTVEECETNDIAIVFHFLSNVSPVFEAASKKLQNDATTAAEIYDIMVQLVKKLENRIEDSFYGSFVGKAMKQLDEGKRNGLSEEFKLFLETAVKYLKKWFDFTDANPLFVLRTLALNHKFQFSDLTSIVEQLNLEDKVSIDDLYDEFSSVKDCIDILAAEKEMSVGSKWQMLFQKSSELPNLFKIVSFCLSIPPSNAFVERVFSHMNLKWTDTRNRCSAHLIKAELIIAINSVSTSCSEFFESLKKNPNMEKVLSAVKSSNKYEFLKK